MAKRDDGKKARRKQAVKEKAAREREQAAVRGGVDTIRRFFGQWLVELRVRRYDNQWAIRHLAAGEGLDVPVSGLAARWKEELKTYLVPSRTTLVPSDNFNGEGATEEEIRAVSQVVLERKTQVLDADLGRLEKLRPLLADALATVGRRVSKHGRPTPAWAGGYDTGLIRRFRNEWLADLRANGSQEAADALAGLADRFDEAFKAATVQCGRMSDGRVQEPLLVHSVRDILDKAFRDSLTKYDDLLPLFSDHPFARADTIRRLKDHRDSCVVFAEREEGEPKLLTLFGRELAGRKTTAAGKKIDYVGVSVDSFQELQFMIAAVNEFLGTPCTDGEEWRDLF